MKNKILLVVATLCIAFYSSAAVAGGCDPNDPTAEQIALAKNMYYEARGDGRTEEQRLYAMQMVGEVTLNRVESVKYPDTICGVVYQRSQFSWTRSKDRTPHEKEMWNAAMNLAEDLIDGDVEYIDNGATHFVNPKAVSSMPSWTRRFKEVARVGNHVFYSDRSMRIERYTNDVPPVASAGRRL